jgi:hypothetical protein
LGLSCVVALFVVVRGSVRQQVWTYLDQEQPRADNAAEKTGTTIIGISQ